MTVQGLWDEAVGRIKSRLSSSKNVEMWLEPIEVRSFDGSILRLRAPNSYVRTWFESNFQATLLEEIRSLGHHEVRFEFDPDSEDRPAPPPLTVSVPAPATAPAPVIEVATSTGSGPILDEDIVAPEAASLNPRYNFDTFVAGPSNQLAFAASQAAASSYPPKYNPVFICGGAGLGKTHLLHSIGHQQLANRPGARIVYLSSERFMNEYVQAIRAGKMHEFRRNYREGIDVLLIDDVQFLAGKESTQDEFFHTFNALHENHTQIVLTADRKPHEISDIADRLRSRFAWGLLADIEPPELEVRIAILRKKAASESVHLPDDVALYIASAIKSNVRELEGALIRLAAYASLSKRRIDLEFAQETLGTAITRPREVITVDGVIKSVASYYGLKPSDIKSERRHKSVATPRAVAMYLARHHTKDSYPDLARAFGGKHHTTVISAVQKIVERLKDDASLRSEIHAIESMILR
ncbi:MAG TPA: chromosomal replication initiator protein DnaA [Kofleriaceae bacterium]|nr:chromosomal replication initiator protein DnaA [Kofleriaceae bacterium]